MMNNTLGGILLLLLLGTLPAQAQIVPEPAAAPPKDWQTVFFDSPAVALPLLTAAVLKNSAQLKSLAISRAITLEDIKTTRLSILNSLSTGANYNYGSLLTIGGAPNAAPTQLGTSGEGRYSVGVGVGLSLGQLLSRSNNIQKERLNLERGEQQRLDFENQLNQQVIALYQNLRLARKLLTLQQEAYVTTQSNFRLTERQFRQGQLSLPEFAAATSQVTGASLAQETARSQYETAFMVLEEIAGTKLSTLITASQ